MKEKLIFVAFLLGVYLIICFCFTEENKLELPVRRDLWSDVYIDQYGDTLNRTDSHDLKQGKWVIYRKGINGNLAGRYGIDSVGFFKNNKKVGFWKKVSKWGEVIDSVRYENCIVKIDAPKTYTFYYE
jgi:hypothetical protein